tara:strand:- start:324 stop:614 length:291 start_codon:yes stop_codon:yes gene_type:complete
MINKIKLNEFIGLLNIGSREKINQWKDNHHFIECDKRCSDSQVIYELHKDYNTGELDKDIMNYVKYVDDEDPFNSDVKWISNKKKIEYLTTYTSYS